MSDTASSDGTTQLQNWDFWVNSKITKPTRLGEYIWMTDTYGEDWEKANAILRKKYPSYGACTGITAGSLHGRNFDWKYNKGCSMVVFSPKGEGKYGSIGIADGFDDLTEEFVMSRKWSNSYYTLPFTWVDGMNENGVVIQCNVIPVNQNKSSAWRTRTEGETERIIVFAIIRKALDSCSTAYAAAQMIKNKTFVPTDFQFDFHFMVSDSTSTYIVEDGAVISSSDEYPTDIMTNFRMNGVIFSEGKPDWNSVDSVDPYGMGLERYELVRDGISSATTVNGMMLLLDSINYTKAYSRVSENPWYSEFVGDHTAEGYGILRISTITSSPELFIGIMSDQSELYESEHSEGTEYRGGKTWQTVHSTVYDKTNLKMTVKFQESDSNRITIKLSDGQIESGGGGSVTLDDTVTENSQNGVKSSGIYGWTVSKISAASNRKTVTKTRNSVLDANAVNLISTSGNYNLPDCSGGVLDVEVMINCTDGIFPVSISAPSGTVSTWLDDSEFIPTTNTVYGKTYSVINTGSGNSRLIKCSSVKYSVESDSSKYIALGDCIASTRNSSIWAYYTSVVGTVYDVSKLGDSFMAVGAKYGKGCALSSQYGKNWVNCTGTSNMSSEYYIGAVTNVLEEVYELGHDITFFAVGKKAYTYTNDEGWSNGITIASSDEQNGCRYYGINVTKGDGEAAINLIVVVVGGYGNTGRVYVSRDVCSTWEYVSISNLNGVLHDITFNGEEFVAVGDNGMVCSFDTNCTYGSATSLGDIYFKSIAYGNGKFVAIGSTKIFVSTDGTEWTDKSSHMPAGIGSAKSITFGNGRFIMVSSSGLLSYSTDGETWSEPMQSLKAEYLYNKIKYL